MLTKIASLPRLSRGGIHEGRLSKLEARVDLLTRLLAGLTPGVDMSITHTVDNRIVIDALGMGDSIDGGLYGFAVSVDSDNKVQVAAGTAQFWGGAVKPYAATSGDGLGNAADNNFVYAVLNISSEPPAWDNALSYGAMSGQDPDSEIWIPIAKTTGSNNDGWTVTQLHWGNIVIPAVTTAVDVQTMPPQ